jgi:hypothetical protein
VDTLQEQVVTTLSKPAEVNFRTLPIVTWRLFASKCPWLTVLRYSLYMPATMNLLLLGADVFGNMMFVALFFQSSGGAMAAGSDISCTPSDIWESLGQMIAVGVVSGFGAMIPGMLVSKLHNRDFQSVTGSQGSARQLRIWHIQDGVVYTLVILYIAFSIFFTALFVANVTALDGEKWMVSIAIALTKKAFLMPTIMVCILFVLVTISQFSAEVQHLNEDYHLNLKLPWQEEKNDKAPPPELEGINKDDKNAPPPELEGVSKEGDIAIEGINADGDMAI